ncbi:TPA: restriction endonuclease subunit S [Listeria innocua]|jgi:type I restriction enzyme S subunit|uniref:restriction endonuclease subunit S n=1 Tax=Bacillota TaxID=1239 RepID=UPI002B56E495|nr:restriction endonuclease subunit S [Listeria innocua]HOD79118.1 restriction endonuclease subunit S [Syntrophorhabdus sp.]HDM9193323.1 restriction endonuclease subunit S [Listeria innocua]HDM9195318.1 restriction endonuclease subunit S [Listeria innocua]HDM9198934.1 restriction endonuclease subunit S [Listeria innocua]
MVTHSKDTIEYNEIKKIYKRVRGTPITAERMSKIKSATGAIRVFAGGATEIRANVSDLPNANIISDPVVIVQSRGVIDFIYCNVPCTFKNEMWGYTSSDIYAVKFLFYYLKHNVDYFRNAGDGRSSFSQISLPVTEEYKIPLLSSKEQQAIASVLSDFDEHIDNLSELIEKKKAIREGALDDLISGRTRVDGFDGDWIESTIESSTSAIITGGTPSTTIDKYWGGTIPWLASTEVHQKIITKATRNITEIGLNNSSAKIAPKDSVLIALAGQGKTRGTAAFLAYPMALNQSLAALVPSDKTNPKFLYYLIENMYLDLREHSSGDGGRGGLNKTLIKNINIRLPREIKEQQAIAEVLTAMDEEIESLETEKEKMIQIKEGAMDDLLTGRVRLKV